MEVNPLKSISVRFGLTMTRFYFCYLIALSLGLFSTLRLFLPTQMIVKWGDFRTLELVPAIEMSGGDTYKTFRW